MFPDERMDKEILMRVMLYSSKKKELLIHARAYVKEKIRESNPQ